MTRLISACLLGIPCRYDARSKGLSKAQLDVLSRDHKLIPICPEIYGGLPTPRVAAEIVAGQVLTRDGTDVSREYELGAEASLRISEVCGARGAYLMARSPSCGIHEIYDGTFTGTLIPGQGVTAKKLEEAGLELFSVDPAMTIEELSSLGGR